MALKIRSTANPELIGDIQPGWSIDENATPHAIGDGSASVGGVQFSAARRDDSEFLLNKAVTVYYEPEGTVTGGNNVTGTFDSVDVSGGTVGVTSTSLLSSLTAERSIRPTFNLDKEMLVKTASTTGGTDAIGLHARLDTTRGMVGFLYAQTISGSGTFSAVRFLSPETNQFTASVTLAGSAYYAAYPYEIDSTGRFYIWNPDSKTIQVYSPTGTLITSWSSPTTDGTSGFTTIKYNPYDNNLWVIDNLSRIRVFTRAGALVRTFTAYDELFTPSNGIGVRAYSISFTKDYVHVAESRGIYAYTYSGTPAFYTLYEGIAYDNNSGDQTSKQIEVDAYGNYVVNVAGRLLYIAPRYGVLYRSAPLTANVSPSSGRGLAINADGNYIVIFDDYQAPNVITGYKLYAGSPVTTRGYFFSVLATILGDLSKVTYSGTSASAVYPGWNDSAWGKLNELCAATGKEIVLQNDGILVRDVLSSDIGLSNFVGSPQVSGERGEGRYIEVVSQNTSVVSAAPVFDYKTDRSKTISADINEYNVTTFQTNVWLTSVQIPTAADGVIGIFPSAGTYTIVSSDNQPVPAALWRAGGGALSVSIGDDGTSVDVTINGPSAEILGYPAPYAVASLVGDGKSTGISVIGGGVAFSPTTQSIATGADWSIVTENIAQTISQPFITSIGQSYDRGQFAAAAANGGGQTLSLTIPTSDIGGLGLTAGSTFIYNKARWRIRSSKIGNASIGITANLLTTIGEHDARVSGETIGAHDTRLNALTLGDSAIKPLY